MTTLNLPVTCGTCGAQLATGLLACPGCARLLHGPALAQIARDAETAERAGDLTAALGAWRRALELLPPRTTQRTTIEKRMQALTAAVDGRGALPPGVAKPSTGKGAKTIAGLGAVGLLLFKSKALLMAILANGKLLLLGLTKIPTLLSMALFAKWSGGSSMLVGIGIVACIYVHEVGHVAALRRYGIDASAPMFIPGLGAFVRMNQYPTDAHEEARTGLAGPLWGLVAALGALAIGKLFASSVAISIASLSATINLFNLIPVWQLDGSRGLRALSRSERLAVAAVGAFMAFAAHQWMPALVAIAAGSRAFSRDAHPTGDRRALALFVALIVAHALIATLPVGAVSPLE